jgi:hypothetical protein
MERESIERLVLDSAMGELDEDAELLLSEYLTEHSEAKQWSIEMLADYEMTASAVNTKTKEAALMLSMAPVKKPAVLLNLNWRPIARWAAVLIFASLVGVGVGRWSKERKFYARSSFQETERNLPTKESIANALRDDGGFWHKKAVAFLEPSKYPKRKPFARKTNLLELYRKSKEMNHD